MSNWDFGYGRPQPADRPEPRSPRYPRGTGGYQDADGELSDPPYPITYERGVFDGPPSWQDRPRSPGPRPAARPDAPWPSAPPPAGRSGGERYTGAQPRYAAGDRGYQSGPSGYLGGQRGYPDRDRGYPQEQRGYADEPGLDGPRASRRDGRWWDPDSWAGWQHWLIAVGVAVAAALIGAALVLLTGTHASASAATGGVGSQGAAASPR